MHSVPSFFKAFIVGGALAIGLVVAGAGRSEPGGSALVATASASPQSPAQKVIVHLKRGTDDLHAVIMALEIRRPRGVRLVDNRQPLGLRWGPGSGGVQDRERRIGVGGARSRLSGPRASGILPAGQS